jgi:hypothetical protein
MYIYIWFCSSNYALVPADMLPSPDGIQDRRTVHILVTCGDSDATEWVNLIIDAGYTYKHFISALMLLLSNNGNNELWTNIVMSNIRRGSILYNDYSLFLLPSDYSEDLASAYVALLEILSISNRTRGFEMLNSVLVCLPWEGPMGNMSWAQVMRNMHESQFKILVVTGYDRASA